METIFGECIESAANGAEGNEAAQDTADFLQNMLVTDCKVGGGRREGRGGRGRVIGSANLD